MDVKDVITDILNRTILNPREGDMVYVLFNDFKRQIQSFADSELNFPYYNTTEYEIIRDLSYNLLALLRTINYVVTYKGIEYSDLPILWKLESYGFTPLKYLKQDHYRRLFPLLPAYYKSKGAFGRTNAVLQHVLRSTSFVIQEFDVARGENNDSNSFILQGLPDNSNVIVSAMDLHERDPLWKLQLNTDIRLPTRSPYIMVSKRATLTDLYIDALLLHHLSLRELNIYINDSLPLNRIIDCSLFNLLAISECWLFLSKLLKLIYKYTSTQSNSLRYTWDSRERILTLPPLIDICEHDLNSIACKNIVKTTLRTHLDLLYFEWYDLLYNFIFINYHRLKLVTEEEIINYIKGNWIGYSSEYETIIVNSVHDIITIIHSIDIFNIISTTKTNFYTEFESVNLIPYYEFHQNWKPNLYATYTTLIPLYLEQLSDMLNDDSRPSAESMYSSLLFMINPGLLNLVNQLDEKLEEAKRLRDSIPERERIRPPLRCKNETEEESSTTTSTLINDPLQEMLIQVYYIISMIGDGLSNNIVYRLSSFGLLFPNISESNVISVLLRFFLPHYVRPLGDMPEYAIIVKSIFHGYAPTDDSYESLEDGLYLDSSLFIGQYYYNRGFTIDKPIRTKIFNLDQLWTTLDQRHKLNEGTHVIQPRHIGKTMTYLENRINFNEVNVPWESQDIYGPVNRIPIENETETEITFEGTFVNEPMRWELHPVIFLDDMIFYLRSQVGYIRSESNNQNYKIRKNPTNVPNDVKARMKTYSEEDITWMTTWLDKKDTYYARYADDIVWIVSEKDNRLEYVYMINQN